MCQITNSWKGRRNRVSDNGINHHGNKPTDKTSGNSTPLPNAQRRDEALKNLEKAIKGRDRRAKAAPLGVVAATLLVLVVIVGGIWFAATYSSDKTNEQDTLASATDTPEVSPVALPTQPLQPYGSTVQCTYPASGEPSKPVDAPEGKDIPTSGTVKVTLSTNQGDIPLTLDRGTSPCTVNSFEHLAQAKFYDDTVCHRSVKSPTMTILQCGDPTAQGSGGPGYSFADEFPTNGLSPDDATKTYTYPRGTLAMANSGPDTNGSQFFLVSGDTQLPASYNVFGTISEEGLTVLDAISSKAPDGDAKPADEVRIQKASVG